MRVVYYVQVRVYHMQGRRLELCWKYVSVFDGRRCKYAYDRKGALNLTELEYNRLVAHLKLCGATYRTEEVCYD